MKLPRNFFKPLAIGAPSPLRELPLRLERMIHFVPPHIEKVRSKVPELVAEVDVVLGNLEDAIPADAKEAARAGFIATARATSFGGTGLWTRINALNSPWALDDVMQIVAAIGDKLDVVMLPKVDGGHPDYKVLADVGGADAPRTAFQQDLWHYTIAKMVDACAAAGIKPFYGPFGDFADTAACEAQFRNAFLMGCVGAWTLHPSQVPIAKRVFSPDPHDVAFAKKITAAMPDGSGAVMIDGKMQDDATWKQAKVLLDLAKLVAQKDPEMAQRYEL